MNYISNFWKAQMVPDLCLTSLSSSPSMPRSTLLEIHINNMVQRLKKSYVLVSLSQIHSQGRESTVVGLVAFHSIRVIAIHLTGIHAGFTSAYC